MRHSLAVLLAGSALGVISAHAADGTWVGTNSSEWTDGTNWSSNPTVPNGTATFTNNFAPTVVDVNGLATTGAILFTVGAPTYTINTNDVFVINGTGVTNNSAAVQTFNVGAALNFLNSSSASAGTGPVTYNNSGSISFLDSSTAGSATIVNNGILQFFNNSRAGTASITNNVGMDFFDSASAGSANITNNAAGTLTFNNNATAGSATLANSGAVQFNNASTAGSAGITNSGTIDFFGTSTAGSATFTNNANGFITFHNTSSGGTAAATYTINANSFISFLDQSSAGSATINASSTVGFQQQATAGNATINANGGFVAFNDTSTAGSATINLTSSNMVFRDQTSAGGAAITVTGGGVTFESQSTASTAKIIANAASNIFFQNQSTAGNADITLNNTATAQFSASSTAGNAIITTNSGGQVSFIGSSTGGTAKFVTNAGGTFSIAGLTAAGMTAGSIEGAGSYVLGAKNLAVGGNNLSTTVSGVISGVGGSLTKVGAGTLTLTNTNSYSGATTVNGGTLVVDGDNSASSLTTVNAGGVLAGSGIVGNVAVAGGTLAPGSVGGSVFGPLTIAGSLTFTAASTYMIQVSPTNAGLTDVAGSASLGNATVAANFTSTPGSYVNRQYTILSATGGVVGTFNPTVVSNSPNLQSTLSYDNNNVYLNVKLVFAPPPGGRLSVNQQNVGNTLTSYFDTTGSIPAAFALLNANGLTVASGELGTGIIQSVTKADNLFINMLLDPTLAGRAGGVAPVTGATRYAEDDEALAYEKRLATPHERDAYAMATKAPRLLAAQPVARWSVWGASYGGSARIGGDPAGLGSHDVSTSVWGVAAGADYKVSPDTLLGFALAGGGTNYALSDNLGRGSSDMFQAGAFARHNIGAAYISAALAYGWHDVTTNRTVALAGIDQLQARFRAETFTGRFEAGYRYVTPMLGLTPYVAAQSTTVRLPAYVEQAIVGNPQFALNYAGQTTTLPRTELGVRADRSMALQDAVLTLRGRLAWAHDYNDDRSIVAVFQALPGTSFVVNGAKPNADAALVSAGAEVKWLSGWSVAGTFEGEFAGNVNSYAGKGVVRYSW